ncbi:hypothetical protein ABMA46_10165 [Mesorhizobium sp. CN5-321]|uniref:hypothetical protein n=1 Tax=Mesorhizobium hunchu TaxID=3157708 RepID=UPI0032B79DA4
MAGFYEEMGDMVQDLLLPDTEDGLGQGVVSLKRTTTTPGENEWDPPTETSQTWPLKAAVKRVDQRYENGVLIVATVDIVTFAVPDTVPVITDTLVIDGRERAITSLKPTPSAGTVAVWKAVVAV